MTEQNNLPAVPQDDDTFQSMTSGGGFLPQLRLMQSQSKPVLDDKAKIQEWMFGLEDNVGMSFEAVIVAWRPHALLLHNETVAAESFNPEDETFKTIQRTQGQGQTVNPLVGVDFLVWCFPTKQFGVIFFAKTFRREAPMFKALMSTQDNARIVTVYSKKVKTARFTWWVPQVQEWEGDPATLTMPSVEQMRQAEELFLAPNVATAEPGDQDERPR